jgi:hypothetical protein
MSACTVATVASALGRRKWYSVCGSTCGESTREAEGAAHQ